MKGFLLALCSLSLCTAQADLDPTLSDLVDRIIDQQSHIETLDQRMVITMTYGSGDGEESIDQESHLLFRRPDRLLLDSDQMRLAADGQSLKFVLLDLAAYLEFPWADSLEATLEPQMMYLGMTLMPDILALISADPRPLLLDFAEEMAIRIGDDAEVDGRAVWQLEITNPEVPELRDTVMRALVDQESGLLQHLQFRVDMSALPQMGDMPGLPAWFSVVVQVRDRSLNQPIADDAFALDLSGLKRIDDFDALAEELQGPLGMEEHALIGQPAPDFELQLLDGETFKLADQRGKVLLIDFWATWCPPCIDSLPSLQRLYEEIGDQVMLLGVSVDRGSARPRVEAMIEQYDLTYPIGINEDGDIAGAYGAAAIPTMVLIDGEGVVREVKIGFSEAAMAELKAKALALLAATESAP